MRPADLTSQYTKLYFNPRTREGCDIKSPNSRLVVSISIHAPAKGATRSFWFFQHQFLISIHAPAKGATPLVTVMFDVTSFQSTHPRRVRLSKPSKTGPRIFISIHAPAKGATFFIHFQFLSLRISIHAPAKGATRSNLRISKMAFISIHAPAKGATLLVFRQIDEL